MKKRVATRHLTGVARAAANVATNERILRSPIGPRGPNHRRSESEPERHARIHAERARILASSREDHAREVRDEAHRASLRNAPATSSPRTVAAVTAPIRDAHLERAARAQATIDARDAATRAAYNARWTNPDGTRRTTPNDAPAAPSAARSAAPAVAPRAAKEERIPKTTDAVHNRAHRAGHEANHANTEEAHRKAAKMHRRAMGHAERTYNHSAHAAHASLAEHHERMADGIKRDSKGRFA